MINSSIYNGQVIHKRFKPKVHSFKYSVFSLLIDLSELKLLDKKVNFFSYNKFNWISFYDKDHGDRDGSSLINWVQKNLRKNNISTENIKIKILCYPRIFGYVFNPLSVYYVYNSNENLISILYEVKNTFGEQHTYIFRVEKDANLIETTCSKKFHVSPFIEMDQTYSFLIKPPSDRLSIKISQSGKDGKTLIATQNGEAVELNDINLLKCMVTHPLMTLKVIIGIHWEAFRLVLKGIKFYSYSAQLQNKK